MPNLQEFNIEVGYWDRELSLSGDYAEDMRSRLTPEKMKSVFPPCLFPLMEEIGNTPKVLDVGSGPVSMLNYGAENKLIDLIAVDPLIEQYNALLLKYGYSIKYPAIHGPGERLSTFLQKNFFDITWCHNALDHSDNPVEVLREMIKVTKYGGYIIIHTWENEGTFEGFYGLHKHNLSFDDGLCLQSFVSEELTPVVNITKNLPVIIHSVNVTERASNRKWIEITLKKQCPIFHHLRTKENQRFFDDLVNTWFPIYENPNFPMWGSFALTTNDRGRHIVNTLKKYTQIKDKDCLDMGTAYGGTPLAFLEEGAKSVKGFDLNEDFLRLAKNNFADHGITSSVFFNIDITKKEQIEGYRESFDIIVCNDVIEHIENVKGAIENISALLRPGGIVYFEIPNKNYPGFVLKDGHYGLFAITLLPKKDAEAYYKEFFPGSTYTVGEYYELDEYISLFQYCGLNVEEINTDTDLIDEKQVKEDIDFLRENRKILLSTVPDNFKNKIKYRLDCYLKKVIEENCHKFWRMIVKK